MKSLFFASALLCAGATAADAACTINSLAGIWSMNTGLFTGQSSTMNSGKWQVITDANNSVSVYLLSLSPATCKGTGYFILESGGTTTITPATFVMERISASSAAKPNFIYMTANTTPTTKRMYHLQRE